MGSVSKLIPNDWDKYYSPQAMELLDYIRELRFGVMNIKVHQGQPVGIEKRLKSVLLNDGKRVKKVSG